MSGGVPIFAQGGPMGLLGLLQAAGQGQQQGQVPTPADVPEAVPPGYAGGYQPSTPPTGAPTPVVQPGAASFASDVVGALGPSSAQAATPDPNDIRGRFIATLQSGGLTNPNGLGAVAAYAQHESRYSPRNIVGAWSDPSESGQSGQSGGILSWRADRLKAMRDFTAGAADPVAAQARFTLAENPALIQSLQNAKTPQEANALMADAWKFAGYNRPGGEFAARLASTRDYADRLANGMQLPASAGGAARSAGFGLRGPTQGAAPAGGAAMAMPTADAALMPAAAAGTGSYDDIAKLLQGVPANSAAQGQGQKQRSGADAGGITRGEAPGGPAMSLAQARKQFDPRRFYSLLPRGAQGR